MGEESLGSNGAEPRVLLFDLSVEHYVEAIDTIFTLCEDPESESYSESDVQRVSSSIIFLREWRYFRYEPRIIKFASETGSCGEKEVLSAVNLPQFSSAVVPKKRGLCTDSTSLESSKDFVMYVGGSVWALDWCPRVHESLDNHTKCEFIAVAAHPPESYYHQVGSPLTGRGIIQIWCVLNVGIEEEEEPFFPSEKVLQKPRRIPRKDKTTQSKKPRGRPRKKPRNESLFQHPEDSSKSLTIQEVGNAQEHTIQENPGNGLLDLNLTCCSTPKDIDLPRIVLCLCHNGKVAWDVKWQPYSAKDSKCKLRMGYLAVLLGNGSLEVWEIPLPRMVLSIYFSSSIEEGTDPRFIKLKPVFRCSVLNSGGRQSIPLTVEWSTLFPHDYLLVGCHDGTVALWKFSPSGSSEDTRPLLCFSADTVPITALAWAPAESDMESSNVIVTAGHGGLKFWDLRDPFRPLWEPSGLRSLYGLDWSPDPRCVVLSSCDGEMKILSLVEAAYDVPATGKPFDKMAKGLHDSNCSSFAIWSVQVSRLTGTVAYSCADGTVIRSQLTKGIEKDHQRNRSPHYLCGFLTEDESAIIVNTPFPDSPITLKKPFKIPGDKSLRSLAMESNAAKSRNPKKGKTGEESEANVPSLEAPECRKRPKSGSSNRKRAKDARALECRDKDATKQKGNEHEKGETGNSIEVFPTKNVAMHRVRWNMNKGSERWLCYGGAAGIVRCQEIIVPDVNKKCHKRA